MRKVFIVFLFLIICGCTYHSQTKDPITPITYDATLHRSADSVGKLRRLGLMPIEFKPFKGQYPSVKDQAAVVLSYEEACARFLTEEKGYDIVAVRDTEGRWRSNLFKNSEYDSIQDLYQQWQKDAVGKHSEPIIQNIGKALNVDGVLVIRIKEQKPWGVTEGLLNIALMNIPLFYNMVSPNIGAWIYESTTGRLVWREEHSLFGATTAKDSLISLFADLENAVPEQLVK